MTSKECKFVFTKKDNNGIVTEYCKWLSTKRKSRKCLGSGCLHFQAKKEEENKKVIHS